jgi:hypothetical protein
MGGRSFPQGREIVGGFGTKPRSGTTRDDIFTLNIPAPGFGAPFDRIRLSPKHDA